MSGVNSEEYPDAVFRCQKEKKISHQLEELGLTWQETFLILMVVNIKPIIGGNGHQETSVLGPLS